MSLIGLWKLDGDQKDSSGNGNNGTPYGINWTNGKIGQCAEFDSTTDKIELTNIIQLSGPFTVSAWCYIRSYSSNPAICANQQDINVGRMSFHSNTKFRIQNIDLPALDSINPTNEWFIFTVSRNDEGMVTCYRNGVNVGGNAIRNEIIQINRLGDNPNNSSWTAIDGFLDDVRIYDHQLSTKEIKELSKQKILHYNFNDFQEPTENIQVNKYEDEYEYSGTGYGFHGKSFTWSELGIQDGESVQLSQLMKIDETRLSQGGSVRMFIYTYNSGDSWGQSTSIGSTDLTYTYYSRTFTRNDSFLLDDENPSTHVAYSFYHYPSTIDDGSSFIKEVQFEKKDHQTPFTPNIRTGKVIDSSGNNNHQELQLQTTPQWTEDSILGKGCYSFDGSNTTISNVIDTISQPTTISFWFKRDNISSVEQFCWLWSNGCIIRMRQDGTLLVYDGSYHTLLNQTQYDDNEFHHIVRVDHGPGNDVKFYVDGQLEQTYTGDITYGTSKHYWGSYHSRTGGFYGGILDDIRIYASILSDDEIKELYQTRQSLDNNGNVFVQELKEIKEPGIFCWKQFGGPLQTTVGTNISDNDLHSTTVSNKVIPFEISGEFASHKDVNYYNYCIHKDNVTWVKYIKTFDIDGNLYPFSFYHEDGIDGIFKYPCIVELKFGTGVTMYDVLNGSDGERLGGKVKMYIDGNYYGETDVLHISTSSIGFANTADTHGEPTSNLMYGWGARHIISYKNTSTGKNTIRCQFKCWATGDPEVVTEVVWGCLI